MLAKVKGSRDDAGPVLRDYADRAYDDRTASAGAIHRDLCGTRVIVMDSRGGPGARGGAPLDLRRRRARVARGLRPRVTSITC